MNRISDITRQKIADEMSIRKICYSGRLSEPDFLGRIFDLKKLPSRDRRYTNAYDDIYQHTVNNNDWEDDWIYTDPRINFLHCEDEIYLKFLSLSVHPRIREKVTETNELISLYNRCLAIDEFEVVQKDLISGVPVFAGRQKLIDQAYTDAKKIEIKKYLDTNYVNGKINVMTNAIHNDTDLAIGTAKELLETVCKSILNHRGEHLKPEWTLPQLIKATTSALDFKPKGASDPEKAERAIRQVLGGIASIVQGVSELRNDFGTGHGKDANFVVIEPKYAKLIVGVVSEIAIFYLSTNGEFAEIIETEAV